MILTCPACATQYRLKDGAIPPEGRQVRCAACKHKWHEDGPAASEATPPAVDPAPPVAQAAPPAEPAPEAPWPVGHAAVQDSEVGGGPHQPEGRTATETETAAPEDAVGDDMIAATPEPDAAHEPVAAGAVPVVDDERARNAGWSVPADPYAVEDHGFAAIPAMHDEDEEPRGGKLGWIVGVVLIVIAAAAAFYFFAPPELKARAGIAEAGESQLQLMLTTSDRQKLASGNELLAISGRVINSTDRVQAVPPIHAELRDPTSNRLVYQWTIAPPARSLAPGAAASFNSAEVDVPQGGESLSLRFAS